nr:inhibitor of growth protein 1 homolog [Ipomoea batatas]
MNSDSQTSKRQSMIQKAVPLKLLLSHGEAILSNFSELWHTPEVDLSPIFESDDNVTPLPDEPGHDLNILDDFVGEIASVLPGDDSDPEIGESVAEREGSENCGESERQPEKSETQKEVGYEVAVVGPAVEKDGFLGGFGGGDGGGGGGGWLGGDVESGDGNQELAPTTAIPSAGAGDSARPWNLRTRRSACKTAATGIPADGGGGSSLGLNIDVTKPNVSPSRTTDNKSPRLRSGSVGAATAGASSSGEKRDRAKFSVPLGKREIEEDFMAILVLVSFFNCLLEKCLHFSAMRISLSLSVFASAQHDFPGSILGKLFRFQGISNSLFLNLDPSLLILTSNLV